MDVGKIALLMKISGNARRLPTAETVSAFRVFNPTASKSPAQARSKEDRHEYQYDPSYTRCDRQTEQYRYQDYNGRLDR